VGRSEEISEILVYMIAASVGLFLEVVHFNLCLLIYHLMYENELPYIIKTHKDSSYLKRILIQVVRFEKLTPNMPTSDQGPRLHNFFRPLFTNICNEQ